MYSTGLDVTSLAQAMETQALVLSLTFPKATGSTCWTENAEATNVLN